MSAREALVKTLAFVLPFVALMGWLEMRLPLPPYLGEKVLLLKSTRDARVVVLGSSHALRGVDPAAFGVPALNLATHGQDLFTDTRLAAVCADYLTGLRLVVMTVSYFSLDYRLDDSLDGWHCYWYPDAYGLPLESGLPRWALSRWSRFARYGNTESLEIMLAGFPPTVGKTKLGWAPIEAVRLDPADLATMARKRVALHDSQLKGRHLGQNLEDLRTLFAFLGRREIKAAIVTLPVTRAYAAAMSPRIYKQMEEGLSELSRSTGVPYFNYTDAPGFDDADFYDADHLAAPGAAKVSARLARDVVAPALR